MNKCLFNSNIAYIVNNINDELDEFIHIDDYLKNNELQEDVRKNKKYLVCKNKHELIKYKSQIKKNHFKHKIINDSLNEWHKEWQNNFKHIEILIGEKVADVLVKNIILQFQNDYISIEDIKSINNNAKNNNKELYWIINCNNSIEINKIGDIYMIYFYNEEWKFEHFVCNEFIYLSNEDKIYKINPNEVKSFMIDVIEYKTKNEFIKSIKNNINIWSKEEIQQCTLYHNQRGAGCGKTYESIQLMDKDEKFKHKEIFIYLTKVHSAKEVIYNELQEQYKKSLLYNLEIEDFDDSNKQYKISYYNKITEKECKIIIGTIDSFMYAIGNKENKDKDYFYGIVKSIKDGYVKTSKNGSIKYSQNYIKLNKKCLIIIDEAQDLGPEYIEAIVSIMRNTYIDTYTIGDKLQSIWGVHNIHTFLEFNNLPHITTEKSTGINHVMRFHNEQFKDFVNDIINFEKYNLPQIEKICDNLNCKYEHENEIKPYNIFQIPTIYSNDTDNEKVDKLVEQIINYVNIEIKKNNYLPNNFMFIFPILSKNFLANRLEAKLQEFWIKKFNSKKYQNNVLNNNEYWKNKINNGKYYKFVVLHKSNEGKSIDLKESENATRILSIHSSKGNGCEVVFLFGLTQYSLEVFSKDNSNLQYESLLHVALTRQKKSLYIGIENIGDDISQRFEKYTEINHEIECNLNDINIHNNYNKLPDFYEETIFQDIYDKYLCEFDDILPDNKDNKNNIVDWGHHLIRSNVFLYYIKYNIINNEEIENNYGNQFITVLNKISKLNINFYSHNDYYKAIKNNEKEENYDFPILIFDTNDKTKYNKYKNILYDFILKIQKKIKNVMQNKKLPLLCPLEIIILLHMYKIYNNGKFADITIMDIYSIIYYFDECSNSIDENHSKEYKCLCKIKFNQNDNSDNFDKYQDIRESIINHYKKTEQVKILYENYNKYIKDNFENLHFRYNLFHPVKFNKLDNNFKFTGNFEIVANSDKHIIDFVITPQFNKLNYYKNMLKAIFDNFLLQNSLEDSNNYVKFNNKKIYTCILSLDSIEPIFIEFNIDKDCEIVKKIIKHYLLKEYSNKSKKIYNFYQHCKIISPISNSVKFTYNQIMKENQKRNEIKVAQLPKYIENYFYNLQNEIELQKNNKIELDNIKIKLNDPNLFVKDINEYLKKIIDELFQNDEDNIAI
jgi:hypothetical protein